METITLNPINNRKSFYGKCRIEKQDNISTLISYTTKVAHYNHETKEMVVNGWYSTTTATHINAFLDYYGFKTCTKKELETYNS